MSTHGWWQRIKHWLVDDPIPAPRPKPSPMAQARAQGWVRESAGLWTHPTLGTVERERDGTWTAARAPGGPQVMGCQTMGYAMEQAAIWRPCVIEGNVFLPGPEPEASDPEAAA